MSGPLVGIRVLDFGRAAVGPVAAEYLGMLGAEVIKIEPPEGDPVRHVASTKVMERLGLGYHILSSLNPHLIYLSSGAYGNTGPMQGMTSNEWYGQASSGATSVTGAEGSPQEFVRGMAQFDWNGAMINLEAVLTALYVREKTGHGLMVATSQFQSSLVAGTTRFAEYFASGQAPGPMGSARPNVVPDQAFATTDGYLNVSVPHDGFWGKLCQALERPDLVTDPRFATTTARVANRSLLVPLLAAVFREKSTAHWLWLLRKHDVPCGQYFNDDLISSVLLHHPHTRANAMMTVVDSQWGPIHSSAPHWRFSKTPAGINRPSPALDEHHEEILRQLDREAPVRTDRRSVSATAAKASNGTLALAGLKVIDVSQGVSGPICGMQLGDLGAEVVKVEPLDGDWLRSIGPFVQSESALF
ncbi:MAG: CoA transferase, partial [Deltaproteobacteria bacterium]|nr:CoA transferase [Deltaproteobacteria bacterium]